VTEGRRARDHQARSFFGGNGLRRRHAASLQWRWTRFFGMSPRGEIAFPMPFNKGNVACAVKIKADVKLI
jgi:hypothetical protein